MCVRSEVKDQFLKDCQNRILQGRKLLQNLNHRWGDKLFTELFFEIEKKLVKNKKIFFEKIFFEKKLKTNLKKFYKTRSSI